MNARLSFYAALLIFEWIFSVPSAYGRSVEIPVTPDSFVQGRYIFSVSTNVIQNGVAFHVTIATKSGSIFADSTAAVDIVTHMDIVTHKENSSSIVAAGTVPITLKKDGHIWKADFIVSDKLLKRPGICFVFTEFCHAIENGKSVSMSSADFYEMKLQDFLK
jgi:hypothetical protein